MDTNVRKYFMIGVSIAALTLIIIIIAVASRKPLDITGKYVLKIDDKYVHTNLTVSSHGDDFIFNIANDDGLKAQYSSKKMVSGNYTLSDFSGDNKITEYALEAHPDSLVGTVNLLPLGKIKILFEKITPGKEDLK